MSGLKNRLSFDEKWAMMRAGRHDEILELADIASAEGDDIWAHQARASVHAAQGRQQEAVLSLTWLIEHHVGGGEIADHVQKARMLMDLRDFELAIRHYSIAINSGNAYFANSARFYRGICYLRLGEAALAEADLEACAPETQFGTASREELLEEAKRALAATS